jgi:hypothetical protein
MIEAKSSLRAALSLKAGMSVMDETVPTSRALLEMEGLSVFATTTVLSREDDRAKENGGTSLNSMASYLHDWRHSKHCTHSE